MFSRGSSTSVAESVAVGELRSPCGGAGLQTAVEVDEQVVITASSVGSGTLQAATQKPEPECLLKSTEAISSSRLYSNTKTHRGCRTQRRREEIEPVERRQRKGIPLGTKHSVNARDQKQTYRASMLCISTFCFAYFNQNTMRKICSGP